MPGSNDLEMLLLTLKFDEIEVVLLDEDSVELRNPALLKVAGPDMVFVEDMRLKNPSLELKRGTGASDRGVSASQPSACLNSTTNASSTSIFSSSSVLSLESIIEGAPDASSLTVYSTFAESSRGMSSLQTRYGVSCEDVATASDSLVQKLAIVSPAEIDSHACGVSLEVWFFTSLTTFRCNGYISMAAWRVIPLAITARGSEIAGLPYLTKDGILESPNGKTHSPLNKQVPDFLWDKFNIDAIRKCPLQIIEIVQQC